MLISTRAPREGSDLVTGYIVHQCVISTRDPREGSDEGFNTAEIQRNQFQPALPARGATGNKADVAECIRISTRAPREGSDDLIRCSFLRREVFQPALPARGGVSI